MALRQSMSLLGRLGPCKSSSTVVRSAAGFHRLCTTPQLHRGAAPLQARCSQSSLFSARVSSPTKICSCGAHGRSEGDEDMASFLQEEIAYEEESAAKLPLIEGFKAELKGTTAVLTRAFNGEKITVSFDLNDNVNMDEDVEEVAGDEPEDEARLVSYPSLLVKITKPKGKTLQFFCEYNHTDLDKEEGDEETEEDHFEEPFRIESVMILDTPEADESLVYQAETDTMDPNLYNFLVNMLHERGMTNEFTQSILSYSTAAEQQLYLAFLKKLHKFTAE